MRRISLSSSEGFFHRRKLTHGGNEALTIGDYNCPSRHPPDRKVGARIAHIIEIAFSELSLEPVCLHLSLQVHEAVAGDDFAEQAEVIIHSAGEGFIRSRHQDEAPAALRFAAQISDQRPPERQLSNGGIGSPNDFLLEKNASLQQPNRQQEKRPGAALDQKEERLV